MTHTPGPWFVGHLETAIVTGSPAGYILYRGVPAFTDDDARVIAASLDMLAALQAVSAFQQSQMYEGGYEDPVWKQVRAAIRKATGE